MVGWSWMMFGFVGFWLVLVGFWFFVYVFPILIMTNYRLVKVLSLVEVFGQQTCVT